MLPTLNIGPVAIQVPGLFYLAGVWVGVTLVEREAQRNKLNASVLANLILIGLLAGAIGARLAYALRFIAVYFENPLSVFSLNPTTLAPVEGLFIGLFVAGYYGYRKGLPLWPTLDVMTLPLAAFAVAVGFAHLASGDAFGAPASVPWTIDLWGAQRHPSQIYEILAAALIFWGVWELRPGKRAPGTLFITFIALTTGSRIFLEAFRGDSVIVLESIRQGQLISLPVLALSLFGLHWLVRPKSP